jgi:hypothetical protein
VSFVALRWRYPRSTRDPPHKQLLVRLGAGSVLFVVLCLSLSPLPAFPRRPLSSPFPCSTPRPPCEQGLAAVVGGVAPPLCSLGSPSPRCPRCSRHSTRVPPHKQLLMGLGAGGVSSLVPLCPSLPHQHRWAWAILRRFLLFFIVVLGHGPFRVGCQL